jgi:uncharacterized membrane protein
VSDPQQPQANSPPPSPAQSPPQPEAASGFDFNRPTIISLLYLLSCVLGITVLIGVVLAYVWRGEPHAEWESSHYSYLIRTFWLGLIGSAISVVLMLALIGFVLIVGVAVLVIVRCVLSLVNAQKRQPMPNPQSWWV